MNKPKENFRLLKAGYIAKTHGLDGTLCACLLKISLKCGQKIYLECASNPPPERVNNQKSIIEGPFEIISIKQHNKYWLLKMDGLNNISQVEHFKGCSIGIETAGLGKNIIWIEDIIGSRVETVQGEVVGKVRDVLKTGANDVYAIDSINGEEILIPAVKAIVKKIDSQNKIIIIDPIPGMLSDSKKP